MEVQGLYDVKDQLSQFKALRTLRLGACKLFLSHQNDAMGAK